MLKAALIGNIGADPELRYSAEGRPVLTFRVASNYRTRSPEGEWQDRTEWVRVRVVGQRAESLEQYLRKGAKVYVDGRLEARPWLNRDGQAQAGLEVFANDIEFFSPRSEDDGYARPTNTVNAPASKPSQPAVDEGELQDVPF